ncbi:hypothetical protein C0J52_18565 [Blattella germanica]|nr:hypothetical protein C0J52_18565 [Blattella germanica]
MLYLNNYYYLLTSLESTFKCLSCFVYAWNMTSLRWPPFFLKQSSTLRRVEAITVCSISMGCYLSLSSLCNSNSNSLFVAHKFCYIEQSQNVKITLKVQIIYTTVDVINSSTK